MSTPQHDSGDPQRAGLTPEGALEQAHTARTAAIRVTARPWWVDLIFVVGLGAAVGTATARTALTWVVAAVIFAITIVATAVADRRSHHRHGRILDLRPAVFPGLTYLIGYAVVFLVGQMPVPPSWQPWWGSGVAVVVAGLAFLSLRADELHQLRRLRRGDYGPYDLV